MSSHRNLRRARNRRLVLGVLSAANLFIGLVGMGSRPVAIGPNAHECPPDCAGVTSPVVASPALR